MNIWKCIVVVISCASAWMSCTPIMRIFHEIFLTISNSNMSCARMWYSPWEYENFPWNFHCSDTSFACALYFSHSLFSFFFFILAVPETSHPPPQITFTIIIIFFFFVWWSQKGETTSEREKDTSRTHSLFFFFIIIFIFFFFSLYNIEIESNSENSLIHFDACSNMRERFSHCIFVDCN